MNTKIIIDALTAKIVKGDDTGRFIPELDALSKQLVSAICNTSDYSEFQEGIKYFYSQIRHFGISKDDLRVNLGQRIFAEIVLLGNISFLAQAAQMVSADVLGHFRTARGKNLKAAFELIAEKETSADGVCYIRDIEDQLKLSRQQVRNLVTSLKQLKIVQLVERLGSFPNSPLRFRLTQEGKKIYSVLRKDVEETSSALSQLVSEKISLLIKENESFIESIKQNLIKTDCSLLKDDNKLNTMIFKSFLTYLTSSMVDNETSQPPPKNNNIFPLITAQANVTKNPVKDIPYDLEFVIRDAIYAGVKQSAIA